MYYIFNEKFGIIFVGILSNIIAISIAFSLNKIFVFKTRGQWVYEYLRSYITYAGTGITGTFLLWLLVDKLDFNIWLSQALIMSIVTIISYFGHKNFTFK